MDGDRAEQIIAVNGDEQQQGLFEEQIEQFSSEEPGIESLDNVGDSASYENEIKHEGHRDSSSGKLFVGGIAWETTEETFTSYFSKYGEIIDSVIMMDKLSGRPRGFGFVTFADSTVADKVLEEEHVIDGRAVEVKRTVPRGDMQQVKGVSKTKKIFVGGIPPSFTEDELKDYFSSYGNIVEHQIMLDHQTGRSRGFGFVTFDSEDAVEKIFSDGKTHELGGKQVEIKKAEPRRAGGDYASDSRLHHAGGSSKSYGGFGRGGAGYGGGGYSRKTGRGNGGYGGYDGGYGGYDDSYGANYNGGSASFYGGYGYGYGFGGPMYTGAGYGGRGYGNPAGYGGAGGYGGGSKGYGSGGGNTSGYGGYGGYDGAGAGAGAGAGYSGGRGYGGGGSSSAGYGGSSAGYGGGKGYGNGGSATGRHHPYRK